MKPISGEDLMLALRETDAQLLQDEPLRTRVKLVPETPGVILLEIDLPGKQYEPDKDQVQAFPLFLPMAKHLANQLLEAVDAYPNSYDPKDTE